MQVIVCVGARKPEWEVETRWRKKQRSKYHQRYSKLKFSSNFVFPTEHNTVIPTTCRGKVQGLGIATSLQAAGECLGMFA